MTFAIIAAVAVSLLSLLGIFFFRNQPHITGTHRFIIPVALGMFLGVVFFELIPETLHGNETWAPVVILFGFLGFYLLSHLLRGYHSHQHEGCDHHEPTSSAKLLLIGDTIHNLADGIVIATAFMIDPVIGIAATIGIALHEIPQEIAEFGVLVHNGYSKTQAALWNLLSASSVIVGVLLTYAFVHVGDFTWILTGIAAGNLLYIAASDMIPELHGEQHRSHFKYTFASTLVGVALIGGIITWSHGEHGHEQEHHDEIHEEALGTHEEVHSEEEHEAPETL